MVENKYQLFVTEDCPRCKELMKFMQNSKLNTEIIDVASKDGFLLAQKQAIKKIPSVVLLDSDDKAVDIFFTLKEIQGLFN